jgi:hypothetical protein
LKNARAVPQGGVIVSCGRVTDHAPTIGYSIGHGTPCPYGYVALFSLILCSDLAKSIYYDLYMNKKEISDAG